MKQLKPLFIIAILASLILPSCGGKGDKEEESTPSSKDPKTKQLKLERGMKIMVAHRDWNPEKGSMGNPALRILTIEDPSGAEGLAFQWINPPSEIGTAGTESQPSDPTAGAASGQAQVFDLAGVASGELSLPNLTNARRMTLPLFWPNGDLFLSNSSGIWISDIAFEELKKDKKTEWNPGLIDNPLLGPIQGYKAIEGGLAQLESSLEEDQEKKESATLIKASKPKKFKVIVDGSEQEVEVIPAKNWLASYKILNNTQNPLVLEVKLAPEANIGEILFTPLGLLKGLVEYRVVEFQSPNFQTKKLEQTPVTEM